MKRIFVCVLLVAFVALCYSTSPPKAGGLTEADESDRVIRRMARFAVSELGSDYRLVSVIRAQTQTVAGTLYHLKLDVERRYPNAGTKSYTCKTKVLSQPWVDLKDLVEFHCSNTQ